MRLLHISRHRHRALQIRSTLCTTVALGTALIVAGPAAPAFAVVAPAWGLAADISPTIASRSIERLETSDAPSPGHQTHPHSTATPRTDGRGVPTGGGEAAPVLGVSAVALILGGALVTLLMTARRTRHLRKGEESDR